MRVIFPLPWPIICSISPSPGKSLGPVPGTGAGRRRRKQCLECVKNLSHSHMSTPGSAPPPPPLLKRTVPSQCPQKLRYPRFKGVNVTCPNKLAAVWDMQFITVPLIDLFFFFFPRKDLEDQQMWLLLTNVSLEQETIMQSGGYMIILPFQLKVSYVFHVYLAPDSS